MTCARGKPHLKQDRSHAAFARGPARLIERHRTEVAGNDGPREMMTTAWRDRIRLTGGLRMSVRGTLPATGGAVLAL